MLTTFLAVWGAMLSTALAAWTVARDLRDRARLQLDPMIGNIVPGDDKRDYLFVTVTNVGRRPILIKSWYLEFGKERKVRFGFILAQNLPRMLKEGEYLTLQTTDLKSFVDSVSILVSDSAGKKWRVPNMKFRSVFEDAQKAIAEGREK